MENCLVSNLSYGWDAIVKLGEKDWKGKGLKAIIYKLVLSSTVYNIWRKRNNIKNGNQNII